MRGLSVTVASPVLDLGVICADWGLRGGGSLLPLLLSISLARTCLCSCRRGVILSCSPGSELCRGVWFGVSFGVGLYALCPPCALCTCATDCGGPLGVRGLSLRADPSLVGVCGLPRVLASFAADSR